MATQILSGSREARRRLARAIAIAAPPPKLRVSEWADLYRYLPKESSPEPGKWSTDRAPYQRGMMDALTDPDVQVVIYMTSVQVGKTETINNAVGYFIDQDPSPMLVVMPTVELAEAWSKDRLSPTVRETPRLRDKVSEARSRDSSNTITHKRFPGGHLSIVGANAPSSLAMRPVRIVLCDEVDRFPASAGSEGDPVTLAKRRTANFWNRKLILTSTPTVKGFSRIEQAWAESDQRRYWVPCPLCGVEQVLRWTPTEGHGGIVYDSDGSGVAIPETARYRCESCLGEFQEHHKPAMLRAGRWIAARPESPIVGFHIWAGYSPWTTWPEIVAEWQASHKNPERLRVFINTMLGETWEEKGESLEPDAILARAEHYPAEVPNGVGILVAGVDVHGDRLEAAVHGFGAGEESWLIAWTQIHGDPGRDETWRELDAFLTQSFDHESGQKVFVQCVCVDSGGHHTEHVYRYCKLRANRRVFPVRGGNVPGIPLVTRPTMHNQYRVKLFTLGVDTAKDVIYSRLRIPSPGPGFMHLPDWVDLEYVHQLTAERRIAKYVKGKGAVRQWVKIRERNEALDLKVYALAALHILGPVTVQSLRERAARLAVPAEREAERVAAEQRARRARPRRRPWATRW